MVNFTKYFILFYFISPFKYFRLAKEKVAYEKELEREKARLETMKTNNKDIYELNKQVCKFFL